MDDPQPLRIYNWNQAGVPLVTAFFVLPGLLALCIYVALHGGFRNNRGPPDVTLAVMLSIGLAVATLAGWIYAFRVPVLWIEVGPKLRYRNLSGEHEVEWSEVERIWFDRDDYEPRFAVFFKVTVAVHHRLVIVVNERQVLQVLVPISKLPSLQWLMTAHPRFGTEPVPEFRDDVDFPEEVEGDDSR